MRFWCDKEWICLILNIFLVKFEYYKEYVINNEGFFWIICYFNFEGKIEININL